MAEGEVVWVIYYNILFAIHVRGIHRQVKNCKKISTHFHLSNLKKFHFLKLYRFLVFIMNISNIHIVKLHMFYTHFEPLQNIMLVSCRCGSIITPKGICSTDFFNRVHYKCVYINANKLILAWAII